MSQNTISKFFIAGPENEYRPPILSYKAFLAYGLILLILRLLLTSLPAGGSAIDSDLLMNLINQERSQRHIPELTSNTALIKAAGEKSTDMLNRGYFAHVDPDGNYVWTRIIKAGYTPYKILGENLAIDFSTSEGMIKAWIDSPTHRTNLLHPDFLDQGLVAMYGNYQGRYTDVATSLFGRLDSDAPKTITTTPPPVSPPEVKSETQKPPPPPPANTSTSTQTTTQITSPPPAQNTTHPTATPATSNLIPENHENGSLATHATPWNALNVSRILFSIFGLALLAILSIDTVIILKHEAAISRSRSSYHFFTFFMIILVSILIWWW